MSLRLSTVVDNEGFASGLEAGEPAYNCASENARVCWFRLASQGNEPDGSIYTLHFRSHNGVALNCEGFLYDGDPFAPISPAGLSLQQTVCGQVGQSSCAVTIPNSSIYSAVFRVTAAQDLDCEIIAEASDDTPTGTTFTEAIPIFVSFSGFVTSTDGAGNELEQDEPAYNCSGNVQKLWFYLDAPNPDTNMELLAEGMGDAGYFVANAEVFVDPYATGDINDLQYLGHLCDIDSFMNTLAFNTGSAGRIYFRISTTEASGMLFVGLTLPK